MKNLFVLRFTWIGILILVLVFFPLFLKMLFELISSDTVAHNYFLYTSVQEKKIIVPPFYYYGVWLIGHLLIFHPSFKFGALLVLLGAIVLKYLLTIKMLIDGQQLDKKQKDLYPIIALGLLFFFPLINPFGEGEAWYVGKFTVNVWHNSTSVVVLPMCLLLYQFSIKWLENSGSNSMARIGLMGFLILVTKPSFLFVFVPSFPLAWVLYHKNFSVGFWKALAVSLLFLAGIFLEKWLIYQEGPLSPFVYSNSKNIEVAIAPFYVFSKLSESITWDLLSSFIFLLAGCLILWKEVKLNPEFWWNLTLTFGSLLVYFVFIEKGQRVLDGNFYWQIPIALFLFHLFILRRLLVSKCSSLSKNVMWSIFYLHILSGIAYLLRWYSTGTYA